jgi:hypothetical protein
MVEEARVTPLFLLRNSIRLGRLWATWSIRKPYRFSVYRDAVHRERVSKNSADEGKVDRKRCRPRAFILAFATILDETFTGQLRQRLTAQFAF